jgi:pimeloyl-ACP methyl ester carboxylesterase/DNA-binding winged helix-turn-helix (wHTH) protein
MRSGVPIADEISGKAPGTLEVAGGFFNALSGELRIDGRSVRLRPRTAALLAHLARHVDRLVSKDDLLAAVWPDTVVTEDSLVQCVKEIRHAFGTGRKHLLRTMPRLGYALLPTAILDPTHARSTRAPAVISHCLASDGVRLAVARFGAGPVVVRAGNYMAQVGLEPDDPLLANYLEAMTRRHSFATFDARGCGLSERRVAEVSFEDWVSDLETVIDHVGAPRVVLFGHSQGAAIAVAYAASHPERVERLVLHGGYARHRYCSEDPAIQAQARAMLELARVGWGLPSDEFRQLWVSGLQPGSPLELQRHIAQRQRHSLDGEMVVPHFKAIYGIDVRALAQRVACPTLVTHFAQDVVVPLALGAELAGLVARSRFVCLPGHAHAVFERGAAARDFVDVVSGFMAEPTT